MATVPVAMTESEERFWPTVMLALICGWFVFLGILASLVLLSGNAL